MTDTTPAVFKDEPKLHRSIGPTQLALYGLGSMLGAGIYGLIGQAAGLAATRCGSLLSPRLWWRS